MSNSDNKVEEKNGAMIYAGAGTMVFIGVCCVFFVSGDKAGLAAAGAFIGAGLSSVGVAIMQAAQTLIRNKSTTAHIDTQIKD